jgi:uncharacterized protein YcgI (DUF1989 family)
MLTILEDTCGVHDTLIAACDRYRYLELGAEEGHRNCADNLVEGLSALGKCPYLVLFPFSLVRWIQEVEICEEGEV